MVTLLDMHFEVTFTSRFRTFYFCLLVGLASVEDLHLHALPTLRTVLLNCNKIKGFDGLDNLTTIRAIVLDNNHITHVPFTCMSECNSLKYLHLEHNRMSTLPRFPNLRGLSALHVGYNRIQVQKCFILFF